MTIPNSFSQPTAVTYSVYFPRDVCVFNDNQQFAVSVFLVQEGDGTLLHIALLQQMFLQHKDTHCQQIPDMSVSACDGQQLVLLHEKNYFTGADVAIFTTERKNPLLTVRHCKN